MYDLFFGVFNSYITNLYHVILMSHIYPQARHPAEETSFTKTRTMLHYVEKELAQHLALADQLKLCGLDLVGGFG